MPDWLSPFSRTPRVVRQFGRWQGRVEAGFSADFVGQLTDTRFDAVTAAGDTATPRDQAPPLPAIGEEVFEWIALLSAIRRAGTSFTMIEGGAGYGRWSAAAACALRRRRPNLRCTLVAVEPEPTHFEWIGQHFRNNSIDPNEHQLIHAAIAGEDGEASFAYDDNPAAWYGQAIIPSEHHGGRHTRVRRTRTISLPTLLSGVEQVDFLDLDIQGAEREAIVAGIHAMNATVRRAFIGTHSRDVDGCLTELFRSNGWTCVHRFPCSSRVKTRYGKVTFGDGVQHWVNPRLKPSHRFYLKRSRPGIGQPQTQDDNRFAVFLTPEAQAINLARLSHLSYLDLPIRGRRVLEVGAGIGLHTDFFIERQCEVLSTDGSPANVAEMARRHPQRRVAVLDLDQPTSLAGLGTFDLIYCYGTLYHLRDPDGALARLAGVCTGSILLETIVSRGEFPELHQVTEPAVANQATSGVGCRPTRAWVMAALRRHFGHAATSRDQPDHPDFAADWTLIHHHGNLRAVFVGSKEPITSPALTPVLPLRHRNAKPRPTSTQHRVWIDVGAHRGEHSRQAALRDPSLLVHAFEPLPQLHAELTGGPSNFVAYAMAVAEQDGIAEFHVNRFTAASSLLPMNETARTAWIGGEQLEEAQPILVQTIRLDTFMHGAGIDHVEFLKIDAQGADFAVLRSAGARLCDIDRIQLEVTVTPDQLYLGASTRNTIVSFLAEHGFVLTGAERQTHDQEENLTFIRNEPETGTAEPEPARRDEPDVFPFNAVKPAHGDVERDGDNLLITTIAQPWAYAAVVPPAPSETVPRAARFRLTLELHVEYGEIQVGLLNREESDFICSETVPAATSMRRVILLTPNLTVSGPLVIRNGAGTGPARVRCRRIRVERLPDPTLTSPQDSETEADGVLTRLHVALDLAAAGLPPVLPEATRSALRGAVQRLRLLLANLSLGMIDTAAAERTNPFATLDATLLSALAAALAPTPNLVPRPDWRFNSFRESDDPAVFLRHLVWLALTAKQSPPLIVPWHAGTRLSLNVGNDISHAIYVAGAFEPNEFALLDAVVRPGMRVVDGGANEGAYTLFFAARVGRAGRVLAVEPSPRELRTLRTNLDLNNASQVEVIDAALAASPGRATLQVAEPTHAGHNTLGTFVYPGVRTADQISVRTDSLDALLASRDLSQADVVKLDLEGGEVDALRGAARMLREARPLLLLEAPEPPSDGLSGLLADAGYATLRFDVRTGLPTRTTQNGVGETLIAVHPSRTFGL